MANIGNRIGKKANGKSAGRPSANAKSKYKLKVTNSIAKKESS
jgi:hypothetical protein